jgi:hypothetical protein
MNYSSLKTNIEDICETSFTDDQLALFTQQAEEKILQTVDIPALRKTDNTSAKYGLPKFYAQHSETQIQLGPTPDQNYELEHIYGYYPASIVTASTSWLGDNASAALLNGALVEAIRFLKGEPDVVENYAKLYLQAIALLIEMGDGKLRRDAYRSGQKRIPVNKGE